MFYSEHILEHKGALERPLKLPERPATPSPPHPQLFYVFYEPINNWYLLLLEK